MSRKVEIGYLCHHGHFQFHGDPDGDACSTKKIGTVYVKPVRGAYKDMFVEAVAEALLSIHEKIEVWRKG